MSKNGVIVLVIAMIVCSVGGFLLGNTAQSIINAPGSEADPLVAQSYVDILVGERTAALQTQIEELKSQIAELTGTSPGPVTTPDPGTSQPGGTTAYTKVKITGNSVNIRKAASTSSEIIGTAVKGDLLTYVATEGDWYKIKTSGGSTGYVSATYSKPQ